MRFCLTIVVLIKTKMTLLFTKEKQRKTHKHYILMKLVSQEDVNLPGFTHNMLNGSMAGYYTNKTPSAVGRRLILILFGV